MTEKKDDKEVAKLTTLKAKAYDMFVQDIKLANIKNQNVQMLQQMLNQIGQLEREGEVMAKEPADCNDQY